MNHLQFYELFFGMSAFFALLVVLLGFLTYRIIDMGRRWIIEVPSAPGALATIRRRRLKRGSTWTRSGDRPREKETRIADPDAIYPTLRGPLNIVHKETGYNLIAPPSNARPPSLEEEPMLAETVPMPAAEAPEPILVVVGLAGADLAKATAENAGRAQRNEAKTMASQMRRETELAEVKAENAARTRRNDAKALDWVRMQVCTPLLHWKAIQTNDHQDWLDTQPQKKDWRAEIFPILCLTVIVIMCAFCWLAYKMLQARGH